MSNTSLGQQIRRARKESGLTQSELAKGIVTSSMICQIENGKAFPSYTVLQSLSERLGRPIEFFVSDTDAHNRQRSTYSLAKALMAAASYEKAYALLKGIQTSGGTETDDLRLTLAECCQHLGKYDEAAAQLDEMLSAAINIGEKSRALSLTVRLGHVALAAGQHQLALYHWRKAQEMMPEATLDATERVRLWLAMGSTYYKLGFVSEAIPLFEQAYAEKDAELSFEEMGRLFLSLSLSHRENGDTSQAIECAEQAFAIFKSVRNADLSLEVKRSLAALAAEQGRHEEATALLIECRNAYSRTYDAHGLGLTMVETARSLHLQGRSEEAIAEVQSAITMLAADELEQAKAHLLLSNMRRERGEIPEAVHHCNIALQAYRKHGQSEHLMEALDLSVQLYDQWETYRAKKFGRSITA
ncbi:helix-turn-helix domain-containing protein [Tumebacillus sp. DT12]|uniref:Helix-turn-helix domain-containing protein n=1 Tax=Tumebacillus lacus TaxID=2995335 RepID=A0ABT3WXU0_9BACL|nr:tetratricopeptide repeat protein [Tumebacillus lacus]MCX7569493.1 helix-turn-helix domain-containing protein [Tumebacillus lacus]